MADRPLNLAAQYARLRGQNAPGMIPPGGGQVAGEFLNGGLDGWMPNYGATARPPMAQDFGAADVAARIPPGYMGEAPAAQGSATAQTIRGMSIQPNPAPQLSRAQRYGQTNLPGSYDQAIGRLQGVDPRMSQSELLGLRGDPVNDQRAMRIARMLGDARGEAAAQAATNPLYGMRAPVTDPVAARMAGARSSGMAAEAAPAAAGLMGYLSDIPQHVRNLFQSGAADAAMSGVPGAVEAAPGMARGAFGTAARWAIPVQTGIGLGSALMQAFDPNSAIRTAGNAAKADMHRDWAAGNIGRAAGDAVRATALPLWEAAKEVMAPTPIWGNGKQQGFLSGLINGETPQQRAARETDQSAKSGYDARVQATNDAVNQARSEFNARQGGGAQRVPLDIMKQYAGVYHMMAPKVQTWNDILDQMSALAIKSEYERMKADPKLAADANAQLLRNRAALKQPQAGLMLNAFPSQLEQ